LSPYDGPRIVCNISRHKLGKMLSSHLGNVRCGSVKRIINTKKPKFIGEVGFDKIGFGLTN